MGPRTGEGLARKARGSAEQVAGEVEPGYGPVADTFRRQFANGREVGAAVAVYRGGRLVADLWGGYRDGVRRLPWGRDSLVPVFSTTRGMASMALAVAHSRGWLDLEAPVATHWPEFAQGGKAAITVAQLLARASRRGGSRQRPWDRPCLRRSGHRGTGLGLTPSTVATLEAPAPTPPGGRRDLVLHSEIPISLGYAKPFPGLPMGSSDRAYAMAGASGSIRLAEPDSGTGFAYTPISWASAVRPTRARSHSGPPCSAASAADPRTRGPAEREVFASRSPHFVNAVLIAAPRPRRLPA
jgi:hypothetical protein